MFSNILSICHSSLIWQEEKKKKKKNKKLRERLAEAEEGHLVLVESNYLCLNADEVS